MYSAVAGPMAPSTASVSTGPGAAFANAAANESTSNATNRGTLITVSGSESARTISRGKSIILRFPAGIESRPSERAEIEPARAVDDQPRPALRRSRRSA